MSDDIVIRLRGPHPKANELIVEDALDIIDLLYEAADEIERLREQLKSAKT